MNDGRPRPPVGGAVVAFLIIVALTAQAADRNKFVENIATRADSTQTYTLYLPSTYDAAKSYPALVIFDPRGRGTEAAEIFRDAAEEYGWILLSSNNTHSLPRGEDPNSRAVNAMIPEVRRYATNPKRVYAAGFSGMALLSWRVAMNNPGLLAGVIADSGRLVDDLPPQRFAFATYGFAGTSDFNNREMRSIDAQLDEAKAPHRFEEFVSDHDWITPVLARDAIGWLEIVAMKEGRRTRDDALIARVFAEDVARAAKLSGKEALRRYRGIARTYDGLRPLDDVRAAIARLESDAGVKSALADEATWDEFEAKYVADVLEPVGNVYAAARQGQRVDLVRYFRVAELTKRAARPGAEGVAARRLLESVYGQTAAYLPLQLFDRHEYALAVSTLEVALKVHPDGIGAWYNLGAAYARMNQRGRALDALRKAIASGFRNAERLASDDDFVSLRDDPKFKELIAGLASHSQ